MRNRAILMRFFTGCCLSPSTIIFILVMRFRRWHAAEAEQDMRKISIPERNGVTVARRKARPEVALLIETANAYARGLLLGIRAYIREHRSWSIYVSGPRRGAAHPP